MKKSKKAKKAKPTTEKQPENPVLAWLKIKKNRMAMFKYVWKNWEKRNDEEVYKYNLGKDSSNLLDWEKGNQLLKLKTFFEQWVVTQKVGYGVSTGVLLVVHDKYWPRIVKYAIKKVKENYGYWPMLSCTETMKILLNRGWIAEVDAIGKSAILEKPCYNQNKEVVLYCHISSLVWPKTFEQHTEAMQVLNRVGLPGRTGTKLPKS